MNNESVKITKLPEITWVDCHNADCDSDAIYEIENLLYGSIMYSCTKHKHETIDFELETN